MTIILLDQEVSGIIIENENGDNHIMINNNKIAASKSFEYEKNNRKHAKQS